MEFKVNILKSIIFKKAYITGKQYNIADMDLNTLNFLNLRRAILILKKPTKDSLWLRSNFFEYKLYLENQNKKKEKMKSIKKEREEKQKDKK